jgi:hypothetical protein
VLARQCKVFERSNQVIGDFTGWPAKLPFR